MVREKKLAQDGRNLPPLPPGGRRYEGMGVEVVPASGVASPGLTAGEAIATFEASQGKLTSSSPPRTELMLATDGIFGLEDDTSTFSNRLSWVVSYAGTPASVRGRINPASSEWMAIQARLNCVDTGIVDAETGEVLAHFQVCN